MVNRSLLAATLAFGAVGYAASARADEVDDTLKKLIDLDQRVHIMAMELRERRPRRPTWPIAACWTRRCSTA